MQVFHPHFQGREVVFGNGIGQTGSPLVEQDQAAKSRKPLREPPYQRMFPMGFQMRNPSRHHDQVDGPIAYYSVSNVHAPILRVLDLRCRALLLNVKRRGLAATRQRRPLLATVSCSVVAWVSSQVLPQGLVALKLIPTVPNALALDACGAPSKTSAFQVISKSVKPAATTVD